MSTISVAFRFHVNFYHSYRGDSLDERGIGKDIRIIRHIIDTLDRLNADAIPVAGTWDAENLFSLERMIPEYAPDILANLQRRVNDGRDEMEIMSYNNGLLTAHTRTELVAAVRRSITNAAGSGVADLFSSYRTIMRPQEMMWTPSFLSVLPSLGVEAVSLYYSCVPFTTFGSFVPPLSVADQFNPLTLGSSTMHDRMPMIPAVNHGDIGDYLSLRRMLRVVRGRQLRECPDRDLLVLVDMDADDQFWAGYDIPLVRRFLSTGNGLDGIVRSVAELPYACFTTPGAYLDGHPPCGMLDLDMDTADGSFDGYASWADKWENRDVYARLDRARRTIWASATADSAVGDSAASVLELRLRALSTTHFGLAAPVMNTSRLGDAMRIVAAAQAEARNALADAAGSAGTPPARLRLEPAREIASATGSAEETVAVYPLTGARIDVDPQVASMLESPRAPRPVLRFIRTAIAPRTAAPGFAEPLRARWDDDSEAEACAVPTWDQPVDAHGRRVALVLDQPDASRRACTVDRTSDRIVIETPEIGVVADGAGLRSLRGGGVTIAGDPLLCASLTYGRRRVAESPEACDVWSNDSGMAVVYQRGRIALGEGCPIERRVVVASGLLGAVLETRVVVPDLERHGVSDERAARLERVYDARLREIRAAELTPDLLAGEDGFTVWRQSYLGGPISFRLPHVGTMNTELDSSNNAITQSWIAVSDGDRGLLLAQAPIGGRSFAFCPLRVRRRKGGYRVSLNPFGTYWGRQPRYPHANTGLGRLFSLAMADHLKPSAPSYGGRTLHFAVMIAPFAGSTPPSALTESAWLFSHPPEFRLLG